MPVVGAHNYSQSWFVRSSHTSVCGQLCMHNSGILHGMVYRAMCGACLYVGAIPHEINVLTIMGTL